MPRYIIYVAICWVVSTLSFRLLPLGLVFTRVFSPATSEHDDVSAPTAEHLVFIGDSLTRYQFFALLYKFSHPANKFQITSSARRSLGRGRLFMKTRQGYLGIHAAVTVSDRTM